MQTFVYPAQFTPDETDGGYVVTFRDMPEAITQGETIEQTVWEASDCLEEAIANRMALDLPIPEPSDAEAGEYHIALHAVMAAKASLYVAMREDNLSKVELAKRLQCDEKSIRRLLDPRYNPRMARLERALAALGRQLVIGVATGAQGSEAAA
ncbi:MAG: type II toxin-antitoxin system HicB family antitoxin [bacterium]|nr:type II toxin-antitoxin system HicB family antitoxin [bacterium]